MRRVAVFIAGAESKVTGFATTTMINPSSKRRRIRFSFVILHAVLDESSEHPDLLLFVLLEVKAVGLSIFYFIVVVV